MGGGGGDTYSTQLPPWARRAHQRLIGEGEVLAYDRQRDFPRYVDEQGDPIQRIAGFDPYEQQSFGAVEDLFNRGDPSAQWAGQLIGETTGMARSPLDRITSDYQARDFDAQMYNRDHDFGDVDSTYQGRDFDFGRFTDVDDSGQAAYEKYMSPYMDSVVEAEKLAAGEEYERQKNQLAAENVQQGAMGGYRDALQGIMGDTLQARTLADITSRGQQSAYQDAGRLFEADRAAGIQAAQMGEQGAVTEAQMRMAGGEGNRAAAIQAAQMNMQAFNQNRDALYRAQAAGDESAARAAQMNMQAAGQNIQNQFQQIAALQGLAGAGMDIGGAAQQRFLERAGALQDAGKQQRGMEQAGMDLAYQEFMREQDYPWMNLGRLQSLVSGVPTGMEQRTHSPGMSIPGQMLGFGVGSAAFKNLMGPG